MVVRMKKQVGILAFCLLAGLLVGCSGGQYQTAREDRGIYPPTTHYERHPIVVEEGSRSRKARARVPEPCFDYSKDLAKTYSNGYAPSFGCAHQRNIAAMVDNPRDFIRPRAQTPVDAARRVKVVGDYREPKVTSTPVDDQSKVSISDVIK